MKFRNEYYFLSNMYPVEIKIAGYKFSCAEAAFQAAKCISPEDKHRFEGLDGFEAKQLGKRVELRPDWNEVRIPLMRRILKVKFSHPDLAKKLMMVRGGIAEDNSWNDTFWGVCNGRGENNLGKILMELRIELRRQNEHPPLCTIKMVKGDLFESNPHFYMHCVSADFALGAGIAKQFRDRFDMKRRLKKLYPNALSRWDNGEHGFCCRVEPEIDGRYRRTFNLVTKRNYWDKPTYDTLKAALIDAEKYAYTFGISEIAMPLIGCGLDRLEWNKVKSIIEDVFRDWDGTITVYTLK